MEAKEFIEKTNNIVNFLVNAVGQEKMRNELLAIRQEKEKTR